MYIAYEYVTINDLMLMGVAFVSFVLCNRNFTFVFWYALNVSIYVVKLTFVLFKKNSNM